MRLLGWTAGQVRRRAAEEDAQLAGEFVQWTHVAAWLLETWPRRWVFESIGAEASALPEGLQLAPVTWDLPFYVLHALSTQSRIEPLPHRTTRPTELAEYVIDLLHRAIDPATVAALRHDPDFMAAFSFPDGAADE
jgi:hypothetical protein